jgi:hypothetical protein
MIHVGRSHTLEWATSVGAPHVDARLVRAETVEDPATPALGVPSAKRLAADK